MVETITPPPENIWITELIVVIICAVFGIIAIIFAYFEKYVITLIGMILCTLFTIIILAYKGAFRRR